MSTTSFFWFDYETFGTHPAWDRPCQFAGVRTNTDLEVIDEPVIVYCRQASDYLPDPGACAVTGITPQHANSHGVPEAQFIAQIREQLALPGTCAVGYNNIRFDDEFTRHTLFRNLYPAYEHEFKNHCSRWDLLDIVRLTRALRPDGIHWPVTDDGTATNRLELLSAANGIEHSQAHDAMSDVWATLGMARLIRQTQPKLFDYTFAHRGKARVSESLNLRDQLPCLQVSGMIPGQRHHLSAIMPLAISQENRNGVIVLDLDQDPGELASLDADEIARRLYLKTADRTDSDPPRPGLRTVQINKCPVLVPLDVMREQDAQRLGFDKHQVLQHAEKARQLLDNDFIARIQTAMSHSWPDDDTVDVDGSLYRGGFLSSADQALLDRLRQLPPAELARTPVQGDDARLPELVWRYLARNYPDSLDEDQQARWLEQCRIRLNNDTAPWLSMNGFETALKKLEDDPLRLELARYADDLGRQIGT